MNDEDIDYEDLDDLPLSDHIEWITLFADHDNHDDPAEIEWWAD